MYGLSRECCSFTAPPARYTQRRPAHWQTIEKAKGEMRGIANQAAYDALTSETGQAAVKTAAQTAWEKQGETA